MPDESCRSCGGELRMHLSCDGCRKATQKICMDCSSLTRRQFHAGCGLPSWGEMSEESNGQGLIAVRQEGSRPGRDGTRPRRRNHIAIAAVCLGLVAAMAVGIALAPQQMDARQGSTQEVRNPDITEAAQAHHGSAVRQTMQNCLAYGRGAYVSVTCPTDFGYVYTAVVDMPGGLAERLSGTIFSIRGVAVTENADGSVVLQYGGKSYMTGFFVD